MSTEINRRTLETIDVNQKVDRGGEVALTTIQVDVLRARGIAQNPSVIVFDITAINQFIQIVNGSITRNEAMEAMAEEFADSTLLPGTTAKGNIKYKLSDSGLVLTVRPEPGRLVGLYIQRIDESENVAAEISREAARKRKLERAKEHQAKLQEEQKAKNAFRESLSRRESPLWNLLSRSNADEETVGAGKYHLLRLISTIRGFVRFAEAGDHASDELRQLAASARNMLPEEDLANIHTARANKKSRKRQRKNAKLGAVDTERTGE